jgi:hypothetical protein
MDKAEINRVVERHKAEQEALEQRLEALRSGKLQVGARTEDGGVRTRPTFTSANWSGCASGWPRTSPATRRCWAPES